MVECISGSVPHVGIEDQQMLEQVESVFGGSGEHRGEGLFFGNVRARDDIGSQRRLDGLDVLLAWPADQLEDLLDLVEGGISREDGLAIDEFAQDASNRPHINCFGVLGRA